MTPHKTTNKELAYFRERCRHWLRVLHLGDWMVEVYMEKLNDMSAAVELWHDSHGAHIKLNSELGNEPSKAFLSRVALHECCHIMLCDLKKLVNERVVTDEMADTAEHAIIRRLENALVKT